MQKNFNFVVVTYICKKEIAVIYAIKQLFNLIKPKITFVQDDKGLKEYHFVIKVPQFIIWDLFIDCVYSLTAQDMASLGNDFSKVFSIPHVTAEHAPFPWPGHVLADYTVKSIENADAFLAISNVYNSCDVFVMTSIQEGLPVSALEASVSGLPVISTRCGGVEDYVDDSMGRIVSITDYKGIAKAYNQFLNGEIKFDNKAIREKAISLFGKEAFVERISNFFFDVIEEKLFYFYNIT